MGFVVRPAAKRSDLLPGQCTDARHGKIRATMPLRTGWNWNGAALQDIKLIVALGFIRPVRNRGGAR